MHNKLDLFLPLCLLLSAGVGTVAAWKIADGPVRSAERQHKELITGALFESVQAQGWLDGRPAWSASSPRIVSDRSARSLIFTGGIRAEINYNGHKRVVFTAPNAQYYDEIGRFDARGNIKITLLPSPTPTATDFPVSLGKVVLETALLRWQTATQLLECAERVQVQTQKGYLIFSSLNADFAKTRLLGTELRGKFYVEDLP